MQEQPSDVEAVEASASAPVAYVSMSPQPDLEPVYVKVLKPALEKLGLECRRDENRGNTGLIIEKALETIDAADVVICDLTYNHSVTYYELALSHAFQKPTILISQSADSVPFDTRYQRMISYSDDRFGLLELRDNLIQAVAALFPNGAAATWIAQRALEPVPISVSELEAARISLYDLNAQVRRYAIRQLGDHRDKTAYERIRWVINSETWNAELVRDGLTALYKIDPEKALEEDLFSEAGIGNPEYLVRERVVNLVGNYGWTSDLVSRLVAQSSDTSWGVRVAVCQVLGRWAVPDPAVQSRLERMRGLDPERSVRVAAEDALHAIERGRQRAAWTNELNGQANPDAVRAQP